MLNKVASGNISVANVEPPLFDQNNIVELPTAAPIISGTNALMRPDSWQEDEEEGFVYREKHNEKNVITHFLTSSNEAVGRPEALAYGAALPIVKSFGVITARLHLLFAANCMRHAKPWEGTIRISIDSIIHDLGFSNRTDLTRADKIRRIIEHTNILNNLCVKVIWRQGKKDLSVRSCQMWDIAIDGRGKLTDDCIRADLGEVFLIVRPGLWAEQFMNHDMIFQYGIFPKYVFQLDAYHNPVAASLILYLTAKYS